MHNHHRQHYRKIEPLVEPVADIPAPVPESGYEDLEGGKGKGGFLVLAQKKCSSLVCSCYAPPIWQHNNNSLKDDSIGDNHGLPKQPPKADFDIDDDVVDDDDDDDDKKTKCSNRKNENSSKACEGSSLEPTLKSNLKKTSIVEEQQELKNGRKVSWPDAHGKDLAHVQEFYSSEFDSKEFGGARNSCICVIQ